MKFDEKSALRDRLKKISVSEGAKKDRIISNYLISQMQNYNVVLSFNPIKGEVDISDINQLIIKEKQLYLPRVEGETISFYRVLDDNDFTCGSFGIKEPMPREKLMKTENTLCIVPGVAFSEKGARLGRGGGYYDRFLKDYKGVKVGICYSEFFLPKIPTESFDISVDAVISDSGVYKIY